MSRPGFFAPLPDGGAQGSDDLEAEVKWLRACMERAGLACFKQSNRTPGEVAEHLHDISRSWADAEALLYARIERMENLMTDWREEYLSSTHERTCWQEVRLAAQSLRADLKTDSDILAFIKAQLTK